MYVYISFHRIPYSYTCFPPPPISENAQAFWTSHCANSVSERWDLLSAESSPDIENYRIKAWKRSNKWCSKGESIDLKSSFYSCLQLLYEKTFIGFALVINHHFKLNHWGSIEKEAKAWQKQLYQALSKPRKVINKVSIKF